MIECPECGGKTVLRTRSKDKKQFYVCIDYPNCKGSVECDEGWGMQESPAKRRGRAQGIVVLGIGGLVSGAVLMFSGIAMTDIRSVSGDTIMESFYHCMGYAIIGLGIFAAAFLVGTALRKQ